MTITPDQIKPAPYNPRKISEAELRGLKTSMDKFQDIAGITYNKRSGNLVTGHHRWDLLKGEFGLLDIKHLNGEFHTINGPDGEFTGYLMRIVDWDKSTEKAANVAANSHMLTGKFDLEILPSVLEEIKLEAPELIEELRFEELAEDLGLNPKVEVMGEVEGQDDVPAVPKEAKAKRGDLFTLGSHRLLCGDSTMIDDVERLMGGGKAILMVTDPPYGVKLDQSWRDEALGEKALGKGNSNTVANDDRADWYDVWAIAPVRISYIWHASSFTDVVMDSLRRADFEVRQQIIWNKSVMVMGRSAYHFKHEPCWYAVKKGFDANWKGDRKQTTVWDAAPPNHIMGGSKEDKTGHPTQKPLSLYEVPIINHTEENDSLYEPFGGSGTAIIACEKTNRKCFMMEIDPHYVDVIIERWQKFSGKIAYLDRDGQQTPWNNL